MARFHINPETGNANQCRAKKQCRFGGLADHYESKLEALKAQEKTYSQGLTSLRKTAFTTAETKIVETLQTVLKASVEAEETFIEIEALDRNGAWKPIGTLSSMRQAHFTVDRCDFIALAVSNRINDKLEAEGLTLEPVAVGFSGRRITHHTALTVTDEHGASVVVDYAARQFDENLPFPYIASRQQWHATVEKGCKAKHGKTIVGYFKDGYSSEPLIPLEPTSKL